MERVRVELVKEVDDSYDIVIGKSLFPAIANGLTKLKFGHIGIITDSNVKDLYGKKFLSMLKEKGLNAIVVSFKAGEKHKNRYTKEKIEDLLISNGFKRDSLIIALGGGVVGDIAGFVASTYMRGVPYLQIPTTLLAMQDSSIGGKTAVDTPLGKNMIGTFWQPKRVFIDIEVLRTLPKEEMLNGMGEMVKHAIIADRKFCIFLEDYTDSILALDEDILMEAIKWSCTIKKNVVEADEKEALRRKILNFGHTIGHAIEKTMNYEIRHGEAVALGMIAETRIAENLGMCNTVMSKKIIDLIMKPGFKGSLKGIDVEQVITNTKYDKKNTAEKVRYVLPRKIADMAIDMEVSTEVIREVLGDMQ